MSSTEFTVGIGEGSRISSKVLKPPGGGSSDIFGLGHSCSAQNQSNFENGTVNLTTHCRLFGGSESSQASVNKIINQTIPAASGKIPPQIKKKNVRRNPITGEEIEISMDSDNEDINECDNKDTKEEVAEHIPSKPVQTSIRVRNPPGGKSSGIF